MPSIIDKLKQGEQKVVNAVKEEVQDIEQAAARVPGEYIYYSSLVVPEITIWLGGIEHKAVNSVLKLKKVFAEELDELLEKRPDVQQNFRKLNLSAAEAAAKADILARANAAKSPIKPVAVRVPMGAEKTTVNPNLVERIGSQFAGRTQPEPEPLNVTEEGVTHSEDLKDPIASDPNTVAKEILSGDKPTT